MAYQLRLCSLGNHDETDLDEIKAGINVAEVISQKQVRKLRELKKRRLLTSSVFTHAKEKASEASKKHAGVAAGVCERSEREKQRGCSHLWKKVNL